MPHLRPRCAPLAIVFWFAYGAFTLIVFGLIAYGLHTAAR